MAYEHEEVIAMLEYIGDEYKEDKYYRMAIQVKEVYAKAKAFDEILNIDLDQHEIIVHGQVEDSVNKYMEDK
ncbi:hypothetical protein [Mammaliicoccus sciuri]|uniref:hypothetical protein n=1 Tax=Mammaliicoccus sciuri TaxID=1296 RepID=UPI0039DFB3B6